MTIPPKLQEIVTDFAECQGREKLEYLLEFAERLPELPAHLQAERESLDFVHECMTPVYIHATAVDGTMQYDFDIPAEAPTVRGFAGVLYEGLAGANAATVLAIPDMFYQEMGLHQVLTGQRLNGIGAILAHMKRLATPYLS